MSAKDREPLYQSLDINKNNFPEHPCIQSDFDKCFQYRRPSKKNISEYIKGKKYQPIETLFSLIPILNWLPKYNWRTDLLKDVIAGFTVAIMHIPQGMAYSLLANVEPVVGIYMAFFPVLIYVLLGTSKHLSMGTFAVICMMTSKSVFLHASDTHNGVTNITDGNLSNIDSNTTYSPIQVATAVCFLVGMWQLILGICRLGSLSVILSKTLVSSFTTGAACHVITSQVKSLFDVKVKRFTGPLKTYIDLFKNIQNTNFVALGISAVFITFLAIYNQHLKNRVEKYLPIPVSIELVAVIVGTTLSYFIGLHENYNITIVGKIPVGFPEPFIPPYSLFFNLLLDSLIIAIVSFSVNISLASMFATKLKYRVNPNQELIASGCANIFGSFFSCLPFAASLSRSLIQQTVGGVTQIASVVSCSLLLLVLLLIGPYFEPLPNCVLASIVVVALKGMFMQTLDLPKIWRKSTFDGILWVSTFSAVVLLDIDYGLAFGVVISLISLIMRGQRPRVFKLGQIPNINIFVDMKRYEKAVEIPGILIIQIAGGLHFANNDLLEKKIFKTIKQNISEILSSNAEKGDEIENKTMIENQPQKIFSVILDMVSITYVDPAAIQSFINIYKQLHSQNILLCLADCPAPVFERMTHCDFFSEFPESQTFITVEDAVLFSKIKKEQQIDVKLQIK